MKNLLSFIFCFTLFISCQNQESEKKSEKISIQRIVKLKGSETIRNVVEKFITYYNSESPEIVLDYSGGGSVIGLMSFLGNEADVVFISKELTKDEKVKLKEKSAVLDTLAIDGMAIIINISNPIKQLSIQQLSAIYSGKIKNWKEVGGEDLPITLYSRDISSGTYSFFKEKVLDSADYAGNDINLTHNEEIVNNVSSTKNAIGYVGLSYAQNPIIKAIPIVFKEGEPAFFPNFQNIKSNNYRLNRFILAIYSSKSDDFVKKVIMALSNESVFKIINESGLIPYKKNYN